MKRTVFWCAVSLLAAALSARALTLLLISEAQIVSESDRIVLGSVMTAEAQWLDPDGDGVQSIYTVATFKIEQTIKGGEQPGTLLTLHAFGGTIGTRTMTAPGIPLFKKDERLLLCLTKNIATCKYSAIVGVVQGRWIVRTDANGVDQARREMDDSMLLSLDSAGNLVEANKPDLKEEPLAAVIARLQAEVKK